MGQKHSTGAVLTAPRIFEQYDRYLPAKPRNAGELPERFDMRSKLGRVRNQWLQSSCVGQAAAVFMTYHSLNNVLMSPQFLYNARANYPHDGMTVANVEEIMRTHGDCKESDYIYGFHNESYAEISDQVKALAATNKIAQGYRITTVHDLKQALMDNGPCVIVVPVYNYGKRFWHVTDGATLKGFHALAVVGWDTDGFILRNSWGLFWGSCGCATLAYDDWSDIIEIWTFQK